MNKSNFETEKITKYGVVAMNSLLLSSPSSIEIDNYIYSGCLIKSMESAVVDLLNEHLMCELINGELYAVVADSNKVKIDFKSADVAKDQAVLLHAKLQKMFAFSFFEKTKIALQVQIDKKENSLIFIQKV